MLFVRVPASYDAIRPRISKNITQRSRLPFFEVRCVPAICAPAFFFHLALEFSPFDLLFSGSAFPCLHRHLSISYLVSALPVDQEDGRLDRFRSQRYGPIRVWRDLQLAQDERSVSIQITTRNRELTTHQTEAPQAASSYEEPPFPRYPIDPDPSRKNTIAGPPNHKRPGRIAPGGPIPEQGTPQDRFAATSKQMMGLPTLASLQIISN